MLQMAVLAEETGTGMCGTASTALCAPCRHSAELSSFALSCCRRFGSTASVLQNGLACTGDQHTLSRGRACGSPCCGQPEFTRLRCFVTCSRWLIHRRPLCCSSNPGSPILQPVGTSDTHQHPTVTVWGRILQCSAACRRSASCCTLLACKLAECGFERVARPGPRPRAHSQHYAHTAGTRGP